MTSEIASLVRGTVPMPIDGFAFEAFPKISRWNRKVVVTEKLDGTNAQVLVTDTGEVLAASRSQFVTVKQDNYGFAAWVEKNREELLKLGPGRHFGEWWGAGVQRKYNTGEKRFSLFNTSRWLSTDPLKTPPPSCCHVVPVLWDGNLEDMDLDAILADLATSGSRAAPGFMKPEGVVIFHTAANLAFKKTFEKDEEPKSMGGPR